MNPTRTLIPLALAALAAAAPAQLAPDNLVVGWASDTKLNSPGAIELQNINKCLKETTVCTNMLTNQGIGGAAYDPVTRFVWISDGATIAAYPMSAKCLLLCSMKASLMDSSAQVAGLTIDVENRVLWHLETKPGYFGLLPYDLKTCPPTPMKGGCTYTLSNTREAAGGVAYDQVRKLMYVSTSFPGIVGYLSTLRVLTATGCKEICNFGQSTCDTRTQAAVSGLAYENCTQTLLATDGTNTRSYVLVDPLKCSFKVGNCCTKSGTTVYHGIAIIPGWTAKAFGSSCTGKGCASCNSMVLATSGGDAAMGNKAFQLEWTGAPTGSAGAIFVSPGGCTKGLQLPFLCGTFHPSLSGGPLLLGAIALTGTTQCAASGSLPLPLPVDASLCDIYLCMQGVLVCQGGGLGLTHALDMQLMRN
ncbi:MAG: hypothetical protein R3F30_07420 [Planctomycetota bacterium]